MQAGNAAWHGYALRRSILHMAFDAFLAAKPLLKRIVPPETSAQLVSTPRGDLVRWCAYCQNPHSDWWFGRCTRCIQGLSWMHVQAVERQTFKHSSQKPTEYFESFHSAILLSTGTLVTHDTWEPYQVPDGSYLLESTPIFIDPLQIAKAAEIGIPAHYQEVTMMGFGGGTWAGYLSCPCGWISNQTEVNHFFERACPTCEAVMSEFAGHPTGPTDPNTLSEKHPLIKLIRVIQEPDEAPK